MTSFLAVLIGCGVPRHVSFIYHLHIHIMTAQVQVNSIVFILFLLPSIDKNDDKMCLYLMFFGFAHLLMCAFILALHNFWCDVYQVMCVKCKMRDKAWRLKNTHLEVLQNIIKWFWWVLVVLIRSKSEQVCCHLISWCRHIKQELYLFNRKNEIYSHIYGFLMSYIVKSAHLIQDTIKEGWHMKYVKCTRWNWLR